VHLRSASEVLLQVMNVDPSDTLFSFLLLPVTARAVVLN
jgi:hypothetical protein